MPLQLVGERQSTGLDRIDRPVLGIEQDDRGCRTVGRSAQLGAEQPQLRAQVTFGRDLPPEIDEGAQATVLVAQRGEAVSGERAHDGQQCNGARAVLPEQTGEHPTHHPSKRTGPVLCCGTVC